jgi:hypothetical protein
MWIQPFIYAGTSLTERVGPALARVEKCVSSHQRWFIIFARILRKQAEAKKKTEDRSMRGDIPNVEGPVKAVTLASPCVLSDVLKQAGVRSKEMEENLSNFTADETIQYEFFGPGNLPDYQTGTFEYLAVLKPTGWGASVQETRTPTMTPTRKFLRAAMGSTFMARRAGANLRKEALTRAAYLPAASALA